jgi:hypothetical protein
VAIHLRVRGTDPPGLSCGPSPDQPGGYHHVHCGLQRGSEVVDPAPGDQPFVADIEILVRNGKLSGPYVHGRSGDRFLYLSWGEFDGDEFRMFRRAKIRLEHLDPAALDDHAVEVRMPLRDAKGHPICASLRPPQVEWTVDPPASH